MCDDSLTSNTFKTHHLWWFHHSITMAWLSPQRHNGHPNTLFEFILNVPLQGLCCVTGDLGTSSRTKGQHDGRGPLAEILWHFHRYITDILYYSNIWATGQIHFWGIPSGKLTVCYGQSPFLMGKLTTIGHFR